MGFRIRGLPAEPFQPLFEMSDAELAGMGAKRCIAEQPHSAPCRVSMQDAEVGEELVLLSFEHQGASSPYRATGPIFVRRNAAAPAALENRIPDCVQRRLISLRAYDDADCIVDAEVVEGRELEAVIDRFLARDGVSYLHAHYARRGCFACRIERP